MFFIFEKFQIMELIKYVFLYFHCICEPILTCLQ